MIQIHIDRRLPTNISDQIMAQIRYAVACGQLKSGTTLPSVRSLARHLDVAPMTVSHAYRGLIEEEVIETKPGIGTFVAELGDVNGQRARMVEKSFARLSQRFLQEAMALGYAPREACEALQQQSACREEERPGPRLALVGNFRDATESYAREMETMFRDLPDYQSDSM